MFILRNEKKNNVDDKSTIREMIKHTKERCNKKEVIWDAKLQKEREDFEKEKEDFEKEKEDFEKEKEEYRKKVSGLIEIANNINEINEEQEDGSEKSIELFNIIKVLNELI